MNGILISLEGIDGSGKSSLTAALAHALKNLGLSVVQTREPGATALGKTLRALISQQALTIASRAEYLLFAADRAEHFHTLVIPALAKNMIVVSDRMADSSLVYQGYCKNESIEMIDTINKWTMYGRTPDITFYLKISTAQAQERIKKRNGPVSAFEKDEAFFATLEHGFDAVFANNPRAVILPAELSQEELLKKALSAVHTWITTNGWKP